MRIPVMSVPSAVFRLLESQTLLSSVNRTMPQLLLKNNKGDIRLTLGHLSH